MADIPGLGNIDVMGTVYSYAGIAAIFLGSILVIFVLALVAYKIRRGEWFGKYPVSVNVWEMRGGNFVIARRDKGRARQDETGAWTYELKKMKAKMQAFSFNYIGVDNTLNLLALNRDEFHPIQVTARSFLVNKSDGTSEEHPIPELRPVIDETFKLAYTNRIKKNFERKPGSDFMSKYGGVIAILVTGIMVFLIVAIVLGEMGPIVDAAAGAAKALADATKACRADMLPAAP